MDKNSLRQIMKEKREQLTISENEEYSLRLWDKIENSIEFKNAKVIMSYSSFGRELDTRKLNNDIKNRGKILLLPRVVGKNEMIAIIDSGKYEKSKFGIMEPVGERYNGKIDLIIMPGLAFDKDLNRVGYGRGYYDRFLIAHPESFKLAPIYPWQIVDKVEIDEFDIKVDKLIYN